MPQWCHGTRRGDQIASLSRAARWTGEYVIDWGPGHRIYLVKDGEALIVLLGGGIKRRRQRDIDQARALLAEHKVRKKARVAKPSANKRMR